jgi:hypothetical protein
MRAFYTLPDPREVGLKWKQYEAARAKVDRIEERLQEAQNKRALLEEKVRQEKSEDVRELAEAILRGEEDPAAPTERLGALAEELRELGRQEEALRQALPHAEEDLRQTIFAHQHRWKGEADKELGKAIEEESKALARVQRLLEEPRRRRLYAEALAAWVRYPQPTFGANADTAVAVTVQRLQADVYAAGERLEERRQAETLERAQASQEAVVS